MAKVVIRHKLLALGLLGGISVGPILRAFAQQPAPAVPASSTVAAGARYQIAVADSQKVFVLDHETNSVYLFGTNPQGVWEAGPGFNVPQEIARFQKRNPIQKLNP